MTRPLDAPRRNGPGPEGAGRSIRSLLATLFLALVVPGASLGAYLGFELYRTTEASARNELEGVADAAASGVGQFLRDSEMILQEFTLHPGIRELDPARCEENLIGLREAYREVYSNLSSWNLDGGRICSANPQPLVPGTDMERIPGFTEALAAGGRYLTPMHRSPLNGRWITVLTLPIRDDSGARVGMAALSVDLVSFEEILARIILPERAIVSLLDADGTVVARSLNSEEAVGKKSPPFVRDTRGLRLAPTREGEDFSWAFLQVPGTEWYVYAGSPSRLVFAGARALFLKLLLLGALAVAGAAVLAMAVYRRVARPLQGLVEGITTTSTGGSGPLLTDGPREIAWVAQGFNQAWSDRVRAEREREHSDERVRSLVENAVMGIAVATERGDFLEVNPALARLLGYDSRDELMALPVAAIYGTPEDRLRHLSLHGSQDTFHAVPVNWVRKDGSTVPVRVSGRRLSLADGEQGWEVFVEDVSEVTRLQEQRTQSQKMEALGRLAGGVAHDFNNLLTVILGQAELLRSDPRLPAQQKEQAEEIYNATLRGAALSRQLLAFGRRNPSVRRPVDLNEVIHGLELVLRRALGGDLEMTLSLDPDPGMVVVDRSQLEQILMNLVMNARDAMGGSGTVTISTREQAVVDSDVVAYPEARLGQHVVLRVADTGSGIDDDVLPHIFEPFFSTKHSTKGTGLGLATVYGIVADSGGHIRVSTTRGRGTGFEIWLPRFEGATAEAGTPHSPRRPTQLRTGLILLVEDEEGVRDLAQSILERAGHEVVTAADGREAMEVAAAHPGPFDLLVTDVVMPGLRGPEVAEALAAQGKIQRAVFISGYPEGLSQDGPPGLRVWRYLPKPFRSDQLLDMVAKVLAE